MIDREHFSKLVFFDVLQKQYLMIKQVWEILIVKIYFLQDCPESFT